MFIFIDMQLFYQVTANLNPLVKDVKSQEIATILDQLKTETAWCLILMWKKELYDKLIIEAN